MDLGLNIIKPLLRYKLDSDLKQTEIKPKTLESYLLDSLWQDLENPVKFEETSLLFQTHQQDISSPIHSPPHSPHVLQNPPVVPNPARPMASRFAPLAFPAILHDIPLNYS